MKLFKFSLMLLLSIYLMGCSTKMDVYKTQTPKLVMRDFFNGELIAHGLYKDRLGEVKKTFVVKMFAKWEGDICELKEEFLYNDGSKSYRTWYLKKESDSKYTGTASDVINKAIGEISGNTLKWVYTLRLPPENNNVEVYFEDWMHLIDANTIINHSYMSKFNINLGEVILSIQKIGPK